MFFVLLNRGNSIAKRRGVKACMMFVVLLLLLVGGGYGAGRGREGKKDARSREKVRMKEKKRGEERRIFLLGREEKGERVETDRQARWCECVGACVCVLQ